MPYRRNLSTLCRIAVFTLGHGIGNLDLTFLRFLGEVLILTVKSFSSEEHHEEK